MTLPKRIASIAIVFMLSPFALAQGDGGENHHYTKSMSGHSPGRIIHMQADDSCDFNVPQRSRVSLFGLTPVFDQSSLMQNQCRRNHQLPEIQVYDQCGEHKVSEQAESLSQLIIGKSDLLPTDLLELSKINPSPENDSAILGLNGSAIFVDKYRKLRNQYDLRSQILNQENVCLRKVPDSVEEFFSKDLDISASLFSAWTADYQEFRWEYFLGLYKLELALAREKERSAIRYNQYLPQYKDITLELSEAEPLETIIKPMSLFAGQLWGRMLECYDGNVKLARSSYASGSFNCTNSNISHQGILNDLKSLRLNFSNFMLSNSFLDLSKQLNYFSLVQEVRGDYVSEKIRPKFPELHPLLVQFLIEDFVRYFIVNGSVNDIVSQIKEKNNESFLNYFRASMQAFLVFNNTGCGPMGIYPIISRMAYDETVGLAGQFQALASGGDFYLVDYGVKVFGAETNQCQFKNVKLPDHFQTNKKEYLDFLAGISEHYVPGGALPFLADKSQNPMKGQKVITNKKDLRPAVRREDRGR